MKRWTTSMKRAGADLIVTYAARDILRWLAHQDGYLLPGGRSLQAR